ncbi:MAG: alpha/beta fold hydrolase [Chloroflexi bacterium]|nr:alpha/beta fold hydrolase [Chloroflexota bacterium]
MALFIVTPYWLGLIFGLILFAVGWYGAEQMIHPARQPLECDPSAYTLTFEQIEFQSRDSTRLRGWFIPSPNAKGAIVLSHGYTGNRAPDLIYASLLRAAGFHTLFFDYRAHGESDGDYSSLVYYERWDLLAALGWLKNRGIPRAGILGFSMGGAVALAAAAQSAMVVGVVSDSAFADLETVMGNAARARGVPRWIAPLVGWLMIAIASVRLRANLFAANPIHSIANIAPRPILIMHGEKDMEVPVGQARKLYHRAREPKELWIVPNARHRKIEEIAKAEYRRKIVAFFDRAFDQ